MTPDGIAVFTAGLCLEYGVSVVVGEVQWTVYDTEGEVLMLVAREGDDVGELVGIAAQLRTASQALAAALAETHGAVARAMSTDDGCSPEAAEAACPCGGFYVYYPASDKRRDSYACHDCGRQP